MSTLNEAIQANIAALEAKNAQLKATFDTETAAVQAEIDTAKAHLAGLVPWLEQEVSTAMDSIEAFFMKLRA